MQPWAAKSCCIPELKQASQELQEPQSPERSPKACVRACREGAGDSYWPAFMEIGVKAVLTCSLEHPVWTGKGLNRQRLTRSAASHGRCLSISRNQSIFKAVNKQLLGMHDEETYKHDPLDVSRKRVLYWLLFIAER